MSKSGSPAPKPMTSFPARFSSAAFILTAMVADVRGSMMLPVSGKPTRNFQAGEVLAEKMIEFKRCPKGADEFIEWCEKAGLKRGGLEGITSFLG